MKLAYHLCLCHISALLVTVVVVGGVVVDRSFVTLFSALEQTDFALVLSDSK